MIDLNLVVSGVAATLPMILYLIISLRDLKTILQDLDLRLRKVELKLAAVNGRKGGILGS
jgi:hypothetical protein